MKIHLHCFNSEHGRFWAALIRRLHPHSVSTKDQREFKHYVHTSVLTTLKKLQGFQSIIAVGQAWISLKSLLSLPSLKMCVARLWIFDKIRLKSWNWVKIKQPCIWEIFYDKKAACNRLFLRIWSKAEICPPSSGRVKFLPYVNNFPENNVFSCIRYEHSFILEVYKHLMWLFFWI